MKILIVTAKYPDVGKDLDGGASTVKQLIESLKAHSIDYFQLLTYKGAIREKPKGINEYFTYRLDNLNYFDIKRSDSSEKFFRRLYDSKTISQEISKLIDNYNICIIIHCSLAMGLEKILTDNQLKKIILFPMFMTPSYRLSGDIVPAEYVDAEQAILTKIRHIVTPSYMEKEQLLSEYHLKNEIIEVIPRSIGNYVGISKTIKNKNSFNVCVVGSFRTQKNILDSLKCFNLLKKYNISLHIVGPVHQKESYDECVDFIKTNSLSNVKIHGIMTSNELKYFYSEMDMAISTSLCETFGRSIFEELSMGLPTIVFDRLTAVKQLLKDNKGICFVSNYEEMAAKIVNILGNEDLYFAMSKNATEVSKDFSQNAQDEHINEFLSKVCVLNNALEIPHT